MMQVILFAVFDIFAMYEAFVVAYALRAAQPEPFAHYMSLVRFALFAVEISPYWVAIFAFSGLYRVARRRNWPSEFARTVAGTACGLMLLVVVDYMRTASPIFPGRAVPVYVLLFGVLFVTAARQVVRFGLRVGYARGRGLRRVIVIGTGPVARRIAVDLRRRSRGYAVVGVVSAADDGGAFLGDVPIFRSLEAALDAVTCSVDEVVQADFSLDRADVAHLVSYANSRGIAYRFVPDRYGVYAAASTMDTIDGVPVMQVSLTSLDGWGAVGKRVFDVVGSFALLVLIAPVFLFIAALVKITDPQGPVFYSQDRVGRGGATIRVPKFRTMRWAYSTGPGRPFRTAEEAFLAMGRADLLDEFAVAQKVADDPRVSNFGRFLRRTSLDELPQLFAAVRGDLSLIGPRPVTPVELERYGAQQASFLALKPGITGLWQVSGRNDVSYDERVKLDIFYIENWSLRLDLSILARTTTAVLAKRGAY